MTSHLPQPPAGIAGRPDPDPQTERKDVYAALDGERAYQETRWNERTTASRGLHSVTEFLVFMRDYIEEAMHTVSRNPEPQASEAALHTIRKVAAMGVACMEQHGAPRREER